MAATFDARVERIYAQPFVMDTVTGLTAPDRKRLAQRLADAGYSMRDAKLWFVDFELKLSATPRPVYVEVKPAERAAEIDDVLDDRRAACERIGAEFLLVRDTDFDWPLGDNLRIMQRYAVVETEEQHRASALAALEDGPMSLSEVVVATGIGLAQLYGLVASGDLRADLRSELLSPRAIVQASQPRQSILRNLED